MQAGRPPMKRRDGKAVPLRTRRSRIYQWTRPVPVSFLNIALVFGVLQSCWALAQLARSNAL